jgi:hypothetical protein
MSDHPRELILYSTPACHLCDTALAVISPYLSELNILIQEVDISESDALMEMYGIRIPVLRFSDKNSAINEDKNAVNKKELGWPFSEEEFLAFASESQS